MPACQYEVWVTAHSAPPLTELAREELAITNGAQEALIPVVPTEGVFLAVFRFVSQVGAEFFLQRCQAKGEAIATGAITRMR